MLEKRYADVRNIILATGEFFRVRLPVPENLPAEWLVEFGKRQFVVAIKEDALLVGRPLFDEIEIGLYTRGDAEKWQSAMKALNIPGFTFSTSPLVFHSDHVFNLDQPEEVSVKKETQKPEAAKSRRCPNCRHKVMEEEIENGRCEDCGEDFWICPRCDAVIGEDPDEADQCPSCKKTYHRVDCPECREGVWIDESKCGDCGKELKIGKCPGCKKRFVISSDLEECPFCQENIYICPRCDEYIDEDPNEVDRCPVCQKSLATVSCPQCREDIFSDVEKCEHCDREFRLGKCPYEDCQKSLIISADIGECPHCQNEVRHVKCPGCQEEFYIEES